MAEKQIVRLNISFDGTMNIGALDHLDSSEEHIAKNTLSNVAKIYNSTQNDPDGLGLDTKFYAQGIGGPLGGAQGGQIEDTQSGWGITNYDQIKDHIETNESITGQVTGYGMQARIDAALAYVENVTQSLKAKGIDAEIKIDVFGFSRGAATARSFINQLHEQQNEESVFTEQVVLPDGSISVETRRENEVSVGMVGLFDTVESTWDLGPTGDESLTEDRHNFNLHESQFDKLVHIVAAKEERSHFDLTTMRDSEGNLPESDKIQEIVIDGVHSDVGGSYLQEYGESIASVESESEALKQQEMLQNIMPDAEIVVVKTNNGYCSSSAPMRPNI